MNNLVLPGTAMPHVLWELQGVQEAVYDGESDAEHNAVHKRFKEFRAGRARQPDAPKEYDEFVRDTVNFLDYIGEPMQLERRSIGLASTGLPAGLLPASPISSRRSTGKT